MKENKQDIFKELMRRKLREESLPDNKDAALWEKILADISGEDKIRKIEKRKNHFIWYAAAAIVLLCLSAGIGVFLLTGNRHNIARTKVEEQKQIASEQTGEKTHEAYEEASGREAPATITDNSPRNKKDVSVSSDPFSHALSVEAREEVLTRQLSDGSTVSLNTGSKVTIPENFEQKRNILLEGEAYFEVKSDNSRPFSVYFDGYRLEVVGTRFNVRNISGEDFKEVSVTEGIVRVFVHEGGQGTEVRKGEQLKLSKERAPELLKVDADNFIFWKTGRLEFKRAGMEEVATLLEREYKEKIILDPNVKSCRFTGDLSELTFEEALKVLGMTTALKIERAKDKVYITGAACE